MVDRWDDEQIGYIARHWDGMANVLRAFIKKAYRDGHISAREIRDWDGLLRSHKTRGVL
jgi:hypothetical protein